MMKKSSENGWVFHLPALGPQLGSGASAAAPLPPVPSTKYELYDKKLGWDGEAWWVFEMLPGGWYNMSKREWPKDDPTHIRDLPLAP